LITLNLFKFMGTISILNYKKMDIVYNDMSEAKPKEIIDLCFQSREILEKFAPYSAYVLVNVTNIRFHSQVVQVVKETTKINSPFVKTTAVFGLEGFTKTLLKIVANFSKREMAIVNSYEEGLDFLYNRAMEEESELSAKY
jgi:hypothetical protein